MSKHKDYISPVVKVLNIGTKYAILNFLSGTGNEQMQDAGAGWGNDFWG